MQAEETRSDVRVPPHAAIHDSVPSGIAATDLEGRQLYVNPAFARMVGWPVAELLGARPPYAYWPPEELPRIRHAFDETIAGRAPADGWELRFMRRDGTRFDVLVSIAPLLDGASQLGWIASLKDIGTRKQLERQRDRAAAHQRFLSQAGAVLASSLDYESTLDAVARLVVPELADYCLVDLVEDDGSIRRVSITHPDPARVELLREMARRWPAAVGSGKGIAQVVESGRSTLASRVTDEMFAAYTDDPERLEMLRSLGLRSTIIAPILAHGRVLGALTLNSTRDDLLFDEHDLELAEAIGVRAGVAIENARLYAAEQEARHEAQRSALRAERLQSLTAALSEAATVQQVADAALRLGMSALGAVAGGVTRVEPDGAHQRLLSVFVEGVPESTVSGWQTFPLSERYPVNEAVVRREIVALESMDAYAARYPELGAAMRDTGYEAYLAAPLEIEGRAVGCINYNFRERRRFDAADLAFLTALARQSAVALERARLFESESDARMAAEEANSAKSRFLATMSHELRTPLNAVLGFVDLLLAEVGGALTEVQRSQLQRIAGASTHLISVIDEILSFSRLEANREEVHATRFDAAAVVREATLLMEPQARAHALRLELDAPDELPIVSDPGKLRQILLNLVGNAIKFTERGSVSVTLERAGEGLRMRVADTGPGIPADRLDHVFEAFAQLDDSTTRARGGTGLGLTVSRRFARLLGGDLTVASVPGTGTTFTLELPGRPSM